MIICPNKRSKAWKNLVVARGEKVAYNLWFLYNGEVPESEYGVIEEESFQEDIPSFKPISEKTDTVKNLEQELVDGFLKDFNITVTEYDNLKKDIGLDSYAAADLLTKSIAYQKGESILPEVAYFAYSMLGKQNSKVRSELKYLINKWDKYKERYNFHTENVKKTEGYIPDVKEWKNKIKDLVILDFLRENLQNYYNNPQEFTKVLDKRWTAEDFTLWEMILRWIDKLLRNFNVSNQEKIDKLKDIGLSIADEVINRNYQYFDYKLKDSQIQKHYNSTIESDPFAKDLVNFGQSLGMVLTGSLALRRAGTVYRTADETIHDIDWVIPYDLNSSTPEDMQILSLILSNQYYMIRNEEIENLDVNYVAKNTATLVRRFEWFQKFEEKYPNFAVTNAFYGKEHTKRESITIQGAIDGEFYEEDGYHQEEVSFYRKDPYTKEPIKFTEIQTKKHKKGEYIKGTGYAIDFFVRLQPKQEEHENYFLLQKEIMMAKIKMGRDKDFIDWKVFVPFIKSKDSFNFNYQGFRHLNYVSEGNALEDVVEDTQEDIPSFKPIKPGVEDLFNSNPELASEIYKVLGFNKSLKNLNISYPNEVKFYKDEEKVLLNEIAQWYDLKNNSLALIAIADKLGINSSNFVELYNKHKNHYKAFKAYLNSEDISDDTNFYKKEDGNSYFIDKNGEEQKVFEEFGNENFISKEAQKDTREFVENREKNFQSMNTYQDWKNSLVELQNKIKDKLKITPKQKQQALQLYSQYLDTIFPNTQVKDIVYHGSKNKFDKFDNQYKGSNLGKVSSDSKLGFFFGNLELSERFGDIKYPSILSIENPLIVEEDTRQKDKINVYINSIKSLLTPEGKEEFYGTNSRMQDMILSSFRVDNYNQLNDRLKEYEDILSEINTKEANFNSEFTENQIKTALQNNNDAVILNYDVKDSSVRSKQYIVFKPEQIHILGNNDDIEGFREFVNTQEEEEFIPSFKPKPSNTLSLIKQQEFKESLTVGEKAQPFLYWSQTTSKQVAEKDVIVDKILDDRFEGRYADSGEERTFKYSNVIDESIERAMTRNQQKFYKNNLVLGETIDVETQQETYRGEVVEIGEDEVQIQDVNGAIIAIPYNVIFKPNAQMKLAKVVQKLKQTFSTQLEIYRRSPKSAEQQKRIESYENILRILENYHQIEDFTVFLQEANKALFRAKTILDRVISGDNLESNEKKLYVISYVKDLLNSFKNIKDLQTLINDFEGSEILKGYMAEFNNKLALAENTYKDIAIPQLGSLLWEYYDPRLNDKMIEVGLDPYTKERLIDELSDPTRDIDFFNQVFVAPSNVDDVVMGLFVKMIKSGKEQARLQDAKFLSNIVPLVEKLKKKYGLKKFKEILKTFYRIVPIEEEKDGEKRIINVREFIQEHDFTDYYEKSKLLNERFNDAKARLAAAEAALQVEFTPEMNQERLNAQGDKIVLGRALADFYNTYGRDVTPEKFKKLMDDNYTWDPEIFYKDLAKYYSQVTDPDEIAELNPEISITIQNDITGEVEHYVRNAKPKSEPNPDKYVTDDWKNLTNDSVDQDIKNLFLGIVEEYNAANRKLPYTRRIKDGRVPCLKKVDKIEEMKGLWNKITKALSEGRLISSVYNKIKNELSAFMKTGSPQYRRRMDGKPYREIPIGVTTVMDVEDSSDDIIMSTLMFVREANNFANMNNFVGASEVIIDVLNINDPLDEEQKEEAVEVEINRRKEALLGFFKQQIYGEFNTTHGPLSKTIDFLGKATALTTIGLNPKSWLANFFVGNWVNLAEGFGGRFYSVGDIWWADKEFMRMLRTEKGRTKLKNMIDSLDAIQGRFTKNFGSELMSFKEKYGRIDNFFIGQDLAEIQIQGSAMLAMLKSQGIQVPEDGIFTEENTANLQDFKNLLHAVNKRNHGVYNDFDRLHFQTNAVFRLFLQFRKWVVSTFRARYAGALTGKYRIDIEMGSVEKGWYRLFYEYFRDSFADGKSLVQSLKDINNPNLTAVQREGIRRSLVDFLAFVIGSTLILAMTWGDDDDEEDFVGEYYIIYYLMRMVSEIGAYLPFLGFSDKLRMVANPFGAAATLKDIIGFFGLIMDFEVDKDGNVSIFKEYQRDTGRYEKGDLKLWGKMSEFNVASNLLEITDPKQLIENFEAASRM